MSNPTQPAAQMALVLPSRLDVDRHPHRQSQLSSAMENALPVKTAINK